MISPTRNPKTAGYLSIQSVLKSILLGAIVASCLSTVGQDNGETPDVDEVIVTGERIDAVDMREDEILSFYDAATRGALLYKQKRYDEAKPLLRVTAKMGFKMSQARLAVIYLQGLGSTERDSVQGIGWLGVAAQPQTTPGIRKHYQQLIRQVPKEQTARVQAIVDDYVGKYGNEATGTECDMIRHAGSHMSTISCEVKDVYKFRNVLWYNELHCLHYPDECRYLPPGGG